MNDPLKLFYLAHPKTDGVPIKNQHGLLIRATSETEAREIAEFYEGEEYKDPSLTSCILLEEHGESKILLSFTVEYAICDHPE